VHSSRSASDKVYQLLAYDRWFSPGTPTSSTTKTGHHDLAEILLKVALNIKNQSINQSINQSLSYQYPTSRSKSNKYVDIYCSAHDAFL
jgi:hypothetical protein